MEKVCLHCGKTFDGRSNASFCSTTCKNAFHNGKRLGATTVYGVPPMGEAVGGTQTHNEPSAPMGNPMGATNGNPFENLNLLGGAQFGNLSAQLGKFEENVSKQIGAVLSRVGMVEDKVSNVASKVDNVTDEVEELKDVTKDNTEVLEDLDAKTDEKFSNLSKEVVSGNATLDARFFNLSNQIEETADKHSEGLADIAGLIQSPAIPDYEEEQDDGESLNGEAEDFDDDNEAEDFDNEDFDNEEDEDESRHYRRVSLDDEPDESEDSDSGMGPLGWMAVIGLGMLFLNGLGKKNK